MAYIPNIVLYSKPTCPFCRKVLAYMEEQDIACEMRNTLEPGVRDELIDGQPLYESDDIIQYLHGLVAADEIG